MNLKGNLEQLFAKDGWNFARLMEKQYGSLLRLHALLNASLLLCKTQIQ